MLQIITVLGLLKSFPHKLLKVKNQLHRGPNYSCGTFFASINSSIWEEMIGELLFLTQYKFTVLAQRIFNRALNLNREYYSQ